MYIHTHESILEQTKFPNLQRNQSTCNRRTSNRSQNTHCLVRIIDCRRHQSIVL